MRAPGFWFQDPGLASHLLTPASLVWRLGAGARAILTKPEQSPVPVICVGNLTVGGAGKTPTTAAIAARLSAEGHQVAIVSRGYGGRVKGPYLVNPARDKAVDVGDEPLLLAQTATVWVARDRAAGARAAAYEGAELILLDDGFQNPGIVKEASILVVDAEEGFGNGQVMPAGPLREPMMQGLARADLVLLIGSPDQQTRAAARWPSLRSATRASL
ncbi:MAG: tetraacyldisaccharide 4'-kinase, partial [Pseudomonadota bacterium]